MTYERLAGGNGAILVNQNGSRFVNEMETRDVISASILAQPGKTAFLLFDQGVRNSLKAIENYAKMHLLIESTSIPALAEKLHMPVRQLQNTISKYNTYVQEKNDEAFHRSASSLDRQLLTPPFYAVECVPAIHHTMGGLKINTKAEVINTKNKPIPGLYAAGEVTGGVHGGNRLGGNAVADYCVFGKIAADSALRFIAKK